MSGTIHINIENKHYPGRARAQGHHAIANLNIRIAEGEFVCLVGPSGCGKTTLLNLIAGLDNKFQGKITFPNSKGLPPKIGMVFQNPRLLPWRTARENIELVLDKNDDKVIDELLDIMKLSEFQHHYPDRLSLGMNRRLAILRAFALNPDLLIMDEPFVSIDPQTARQIRNLLLELWSKRPHSVLFVTHDLREAIALADRLILLSPPPMQVVQEISIPLARAERTDSAIEILREQFIETEFLAQSLL